MPDLLRSIKSFLTEGSVVAAGSFTNPAKVAPHVRCGFRPRDVRWGEKLCTRGPAERAAGTTVRRKVAMAGRVPSARLRKKRVLVVRFVDDRLRFYRRYSVAYWRNRCQKKGVVIDDIGEGDLK